jgi:hypothetical protein
MSTAANQNLSLGKLRRAVDGNDSYTAESSLGSTCGGTTSADADVKMSDFSISSVDDITGYAYLWESTSETYTMNFSNAGGRFLTRVGRNQFNFDWQDNSSVIAPKAASNYTSSVAAGAISNANTGTNDDSDWYPAGTNNAAVALTGSFKEDGQTDGYNDHATNYNTKLYKTLTVVDSYGGSPSCLLTGTPIKMADGSTKLVEDLQIGEWVLAMNMPGQIDEDESDWRKCKFSADDTETFTQHSASVQDINFDFSLNYWDINDGQEMITGEHEMLYKPEWDQSKWMWQLVPNMKVGGHLMDKNGDSIEITSLTNVYDADGFEVVQIDVEPLDVYFGKSFLVHNKGSNSNPF